MLSRSGFFIVDLIRSDYRFKNPEKSITSRSRSDLIFFFFQKNMDFFFQKKMEERDPWAAFGSKKFPFPNRKSSKKIL